LSKSAEALLDPGLGFAESILSAAAGGVEGPGNGKKTIRFFFPGAEKNAPNR
jgi:hypothetical protein